MKYKHLREEYKVPALLEEQLMESPFDMFESWFEEAIKSEPKDANAMVLSTLGLDGFPQGRVVLLKEVDHGFVWFTNYQSQKGHELSLNPKAGLTFWWPSLARQVRVTGTVEKISEADSEAYFHSRPRSSQAGAIASEQSKPINGREELDIRFSEILALPPEVEFKKPAHWGGYRLLPTYFEFWQGRESRLHDRLYYRQENGQDWTTGRLSP